MYIIVQLKERITAVTSWHWRENLPDWAHSVVSALLSPDHTGKNIWSQKSNWKDQEAKKLTPPSAPLLSSCYLAHLLLSTACQRPYPSSPQKVMRALHSYLCTLFSVGESMDQIYAVQDDTLCTKHSYKSTFLLSKPNLSLISGPISLALTTAVTMGLTLCWVCVLGLEDLHAC